MSWHDLLRTRGSGWVILIRPMVGLAVLPPEGIQKLIFPEILGAGRLTRIGIPFSALVDRTLFCAIVQR
jgi:putative oxidoreductase